MTIGNKTHQVKCIENLGGHNIGKYKIHTGNMVPIVKTDNQTKMLEGEQYAIETFATTGRGYVQDDANCSHYMKNYDKPPPAKPIKLMPAAKALLEHIDAHYGTLAWCKRYLVEDGFDKF